MIDKTYEILHSPFDIQTHKKTFINYLEVIIDSSGVIHYAVPSHQEFMINYICTHDNITREELSDMVPKEYYCDILTWLTNKSNCISVWNNWYIGIANQSQIDSLKLLCNENLYYGEIAN